MTRDQGADCPDARVKIGTANCSYCSWSDPMKLLVKVAWETQFIGILNTFGFDHVEIESFRQLCINSAKEKFQQSWKPLRSNTTNTAFRGRISTSKTIQMSSIWKKVTELFEWGIDAGNLLRRGISEKSGCCDGEQSASGLYAWITGHLQSVITRAKSLTTREAFWISIAMRFCLKGVISEGVDFEQNVCNWCQWDEKADSFDVIPTKGPDAATTNDCSTQFRMSLTELMDKISIKQVHYVCCVKSTSYKSLVAFSHDDCVRYLDVLAS